MVSLKDIAKECGVSVATVSKSLNDHGDIGEETKMKVRETAKRLGYQPNAAAQALKTRRTYNIGVLFVDDGNSGLTHDFFNHVLNSFKFAAEGFGYDLTFISNEKNGAHAMTYLEHARYRGFDGVVIACVDFELPDIKELVNSDIPVVTIDHIFNNKIAIMSDNVEGMKSLVDLVVEKGHRRIAYIHGTPSLVTNARLSSFHKSLEDHGITVPDEYLKLNHYRNTEIAYEMTNELLDLPNPPSCIFYSDDFASIGGSKAIYERGLRIPEDISIVGYDGIEITQQMSPKLTTFRQNTEEIGSTAAELLISLIEKPKSTLIQPIVINGTVLEGESLAKLK